MDPHRDRDGRFCGMRVKVGTVWRLPTFPARWLLADPRSRPYFVVWSRQQNELVSMLRMEAVDAGQWVKLTNDVGRTFRIALVRRPLPTGSGTALLYRCPGCGRERRYLYGHAVVDGDLVENRAWLCQVCAGLRWRTPGRYRSPATRSPEAALIASLGLPELHEPVPRPWDPEAVSDPRSLFDRFSNLYPAPSKPRRRKRSGTPRNRQPTS